MSALELVYDYFEDHVRAAVVVRQRPPLALALLCFIIGSISLFCAQALAQRLILPFSWYTCLFLIVWQIFSGFLLTGILHLILDMGDIEGSAAGLFVLLGFSQLAWALAVPLVLLVQLAMPSSSLALTCAFFFAGGTSFLLKARGLQDNYHISAGRAWLTLCLPFLALAGLVFLVISLAFVGVAYELVQILS